ncbi:MAG: protease inhibitor I42 family protein [Patescibacteria group bacterium]|nr:protease inhibitor I42 family protein [Patescibacteria group bacterium]
MKNKLLIWIIVLIVIIAGGLALYFYKDKIFKNLPSSVNISDSSNGQTITLKKSQKIIVTLTDPGDGGYVFADPAYNKEIIQLTDYQNIPSTSGAVGDFGSDKWTFEAIKSGSTDLQYEIYRPWLPNEHLPKLSVKIEVK